MKTSLQIKLGQQLTMTPQLQQAIRLLQLSTQELQSEIQVALESNPMLEEQENKPIEFRTDYQVPSMTSPRSGTEHMSQDDYLDYFNQLHGNHETLQQHLQWQLQMTPFSERDRMITMVIIDSLNDDGYLQASIEDLQTVFDAELEIEKDEIEAMLHWLQHCEPRGVAARSIQECLLLQLDKLDPETPHLALTTKIIGSYFDLLASRQYAKLMRKNKINEQTLQDVMALIRQLNPRPGNQVNSKTASYVHPDVLVFKKNGTWCVELNQEAMPRLKLNQTYVNLVKQTDQSSDNLYLKGQLQEAKWLLKSLESRSDTLLKVARSIVARQTGFLEFGEEAMQPLILQEIAEAIEMHESTISRVTTQKFMHTPRGMFELKYFFSSYVNTQEGGCCSSTAIRALIKKLIAQEKPSKPLSDNKIALLLQEQGIAVARRTVAKYRESMLIPPSNERKGL